VVVVTSLKDTALSARACPAVVNTVLLVGGLLLLDLDDHSPVAPPTTAVDEEEDDEDDQGMLPIVEKPTTVFARWPNDDKWETLGLGNLAIYYDSEIYAERIVLKLDDSEEYASNTIIGMNTVMQVTIVFVYKIRFIEPFLPTNHKLTKFRFGI
jgi:hypothetical protein